MTERNAGLLSPRIGRSPTSIIQARCRLRGMTDEDRVSAREFYLALHTATSELKSLIITIRSETEQSMQAKHASIRNALNENFKLVSEQMKSHEDEDQAIADRVLILEETQKRMMWVGFIVVPSILAAWEWVKRVLHLA